MLFPRAPAPARAPRRAADVDGPCPWCRGSARPTARRATPTASPLVANGPGMPLLGEHARGRFTRPHLRGHRVGGPATWTTWFRAATQSSRRRPAALRADRPGRRAGAGLPSSSRCPAARCAAAARVTNTGPGDYVVEGLEVVLPARRTTMSSCSTSPAGTSASAPRSGTPSPTGSGCARAAAVGPGSTPPPWWCRARPGFSTTHGERASACTSAGAATRCCGSSATAAHRHHHRRRRAAAAGRGGAGAGRVATPRPWVYVAAADDGLDGLAAVWHALPALARRPPGAPAGRAQRLGGGLLRPRPRPAAGDRRPGGRASGVERFVLDDGWFHDAARRHRRPRRLEGRPEHVWPEGLTRSSTTCAGSGMEFGLWFEPEMVNPDSDLYREHPDWILVRRRPGAAAAPQPAGARPVARRGRRRTSSTRSARCSRRTPIDYVKWDHNRDLLEAGSGALGGAPAVHAQTLAFYALLDELRAAHPASTGSRARPVADGSTSACSSACSGSGPRT